MGIDAQRSGASELSDRAVEVRRGRIAYPIPSGCPGTPWYARRELGRATSAVQTSDEPSRRKAVSRHTVDDEQRGDRPHSGPCSLRQTDDGRAQQDPCALRVAAAGGRLLRCGGSTMCTDIACAAAPCIRPPGARNAAICTFTTDC